MLDKIMGGIWGLCVGDAVGVPFEFRSRAALKKAPATDMRGYGTYHQPAGTWSDDTSMALCLLDSLSHGLDYKDIMLKFRLWLENAEYTPHGEVFDVGRTSGEAVSRFAKGTPPLQCGGKSEHDNGNGSLMRILPLVFYLHSQYGEKIFENEEAVTTIHNVSALTHAHKRSQLACGIYLSIADIMMGNTQLQYAVDLGIGRAWEYYSKRAEYAPELRHYKRIYSPDFQATPEEQIKSSGYVVDTLEAALWCLLNTTSYEECILKAVNLGEDTDTTAAVAGGLAGMYYGYEAIPTRWRSSIAKTEFITELCTALYHFLNLNEFGKLRSFIPCFEASFAREKVEDVPTTMDYPACDDWLRQFIDEVSNSCLIDYSYGETIHRYGLEMNDDFAKHIDTADLELTKAILTCYIRQERFCEGLWKRAVNEGTFLSLLRRLETLLKPSVENIPSCPKAGSANCHRGLKLTLLKKLRNYFSKIL